jgi:hypothetical protein
MVRALLLLLFVFVLAYKGSSVCLLVDGGVRARMQVLVGKGGSVAVAVVVVGMYAGAGGRFGEKMVRGGGGSEVGGGPFRSGSRRVVLSG